MLRVGLRTISQEANVLKAALRPNTAGQRVKLAADWLDKLKAFVQKGRMYVFWPIFILCRIELIFGRLNCFDMKNIVL